MAPPAAGHSILPDPLTTLIGREQESADVSALLLRREVRLLTLVGPGGVGKTRLALRVVEELKTAFADGVVFVDLSAVRDPTLVAKTIAQAVGARQADVRPPEEILRETLRHGHRLLMLDNFEQVVEAAPLLPQLLSACPGLSVLVTSRNVLHVSGEHNYPVLPLAAPDDAVELVTAKIIAFPAVQLFDHRAQAVRPEFIVTDVNAAAVAAIVKRLDGLPLAIELAAARTNAFSPVALLERLTARLPFLTAGPFDAPDRLRTMRDAVAWSYDLLSPDEQRLFRHLAVFVSGFDVEAAEVVAGATHVATGAIFEGVISLVDKSLIRPADGTGEASRFVMLETIREFALPQCHE